MVTETVEISKDDYQKAIAEDAMAIITSPRLLYGYGVYSASVREIDGKYYLTYTRGSSCD